MGIIAWIVLGLVAGLIANALIPGRRQQGLILTCVIGIVGALLGGWLATKLFHIHTLHGFFNLDTWLTAIIGAAILLLAYHLVTSRSGTSTGRRRTTPPVRAQVNSRSDLWTAYPALTEADHAVHVQFLISQGRAHHRSRSPRARPMIAVSNCSGPRRPI